MGKNPEEYLFHAMASNLGMRKKGVFGLDYLISGFEYTRLVQGIYYNIIPTPNWYDNPRYDYSSYNNMRWGAHSGSDSDDLLIFSGYSNNSMTFSFGLNYERHGVTYNFPPEVKIELKSSISYRINNIYVSINYENELFRHYGFVDSNRNVWTEEFEEGSIQRTSTLLFNLDYKI